MTTFKFLKNISFTAGLLYLMLTLSLSSCHRPFDNRDNLLKIDTLQGLVNQVDATLILDEDPIGKRNDSMKIKLNAIKALYKDTANGEITASIVRYSGIQKTYDDFLKNYPVMEFDEVRHKAIISEFKNKAVSGSISQEIFDSTYNKELLLLKVLLGKAKTMTYNTTAIEEDFHRHDPVVTRIYHMVRKENEPE